MSSTLKTASLGLILLASFAWLSYSVIAEPKPAVHQHVNMSQCADACARCAIACSTCFEHCLQMLKEGNKDHARTAALCNDCAALCALASQVESRGGPLKQLICDACAQACDKCADECEKYSNQAHMLACAAACRDCSKACREMMKHIGHGR